MFANGAANFKMVKMVLKDRRVVERVFIVLLNIMMNYKNFIVRDVRFPILKNIKNIFCINLTIL